MDTAAVGGFPPRNGRNGLVLKALQLLAAAVFAGWLMIWIVMPTNTYRNGWSLRIRAETDSTYFGRQGVVLLLSFFDADELAKNSSLYKFSITPTTGFCILILCALYGAGTNILINTFPILFISVLGCLYLHLVKRSDTSQRYTIHLMASLWWKMVKWDNTGTAYVAGEIALLAGLAMWAMTLPRIRRKMFELFFYTHQLYIVFLFFYLMHVGISHFCMILPGVYLFMVDRYLRFLQSKTKVRLVSARLLPSESIELNFAKSPGLAFEPLSVVFINVPGVSSLQWHPFTVSSSSNLEPERLSVIIKKEGSWTQKLYRTLSSPVPQDRLEVSVEGPYGPVSKNFLRSLRTYFDPHRYDSLILVSGGSGITPFISIIRELIHQRTTLNRPTPAVLLVCAFKTAADLTMLDLLLPVSGNISDLSGLELRIEAFVTREESSTDEAQTNIRTIWFKPLPSDVPIAPVLGPNGWLWLAAIVSSSFVAFLLLIGVLQRYYIYPIDHNTNQIYSYAARSVLNLLFICICIMAAASAAVLWNKKGNSKEARQIQNIDALTPTTSPSSWFYNADRELESVPQESLVKATKVHFGGRPPLKSKKPALLSKFALRWLSELIKVWSASFLVDLGQQDKSCNDCSSQVSSKLLHLLVQATVAVKLPMSEEDKVAAKVLFQGLTILRKAKMDLLVLSFLLPLFLTSTTAFTPNTSYFLNCEICCSGSPSPSRPPPLPLPLPLPLLPRYNLDLHIPLIDIKASSNGFDESLVVGSGGFGRGL
ncbi:hypothetical protein GW17_00038453 [Ensete ventricosum]|nr:hypothetical protein GW17_00038453 [Ensete ventricosum]